IVDNINRGLLKGNVTNRIV
ncbi:MAG: hypothetical protein ABW168_06955, partial [Sedimenticola sp.]